MSSNKEIKTAEETLIEKIPNFAFENIAWFDVKFQRYDFVNANTVAFKIKDAMKQYASQAVRIALEEAANRIESEYDFDGSWKSDKNPKGLVNTKVKQSILSLEKTIIDKLK
jgi:hypothetical protein